ncbi:MAG: hypothetical protein ACLQHF_05000, partial [Terracidiphilus sp.]
SASRSQTINPQPTLSGRKPLQKPENHLQPRRHYKTTHLRRGSLKLHSKSTLLHSKTTPLHS